MREPAARTCAGIEAGAVGASRRGGVDALASASALRQQALVDRVARAKRIAAWAGRLASRVWSM